MDTDVVIVGAGPVGIFGVFECGMQRLSCHVVDAMESLGGQCSALYPEKPIYDIPGFSRVDASELIYRLHEQAAPFSPVYHLGKTAQTLKRLPNGRLEVLLSNGLALSCGAVIIAAGAGALRPNRPPLAGIEEYEGRGVLYRLTNVESLRGRKVVIAGGGDSAIDWALALVGVASHIALVHRRERFRAAPVSVHALAQAQAKGQIDVVTPCQLHAIEGRDGVLGAVIVTDTHGKSRRIEADTLLALFGMATDIGSIAQWGLSLNQGQIEVTQQDCQTSVPGLYAAGDIATYPSKLKLILSGFSEIASAAHAIRRQMFPDEIQHFEHSTTVGVPGLMGLDDAALSSNESPKSIESELAVF
ncbi:MAG: NAD(P)/FAD-dependent oxidoreductase [Burkholderiaceae bacterium]|nr:NAD(P)/FAD-dependent oxidoreductase [Burkholderiaceae bacterium]